MATTSLSNRSSVTLNLDCLTLKVICCSCFIYSVLILGTCLNLILKICLPIAVHTLISLLCLFYFSEIVLCSISLKPRKLWVNPCFYVYPELLFPSAFLASIQLSRECPLPHGISGCCTGLSLTYIPGQQDQGIFTVVCRPGFLCLLVLPLGVGFLAAVPHPQSLWSSRTWDSHSQSSLGARCAYRSIDRHCSYRTGKGHQHALPSLWSGFSSAALVVVDNLSAVIVILGIYFYFLTCHHWKSSLGSFMYAPNSFSEQGKD